MSEIRDNVQQAPMRSDDNEEASLGSNYSVSSSDRQQPCMVEAAVEGMVLLIGTYHLPDGRIAILYLAWNDSPDALAKQGVSATVSRGSSSHLQEEVAEGWLGEKWSRAGLPFSEVGCDMSPSASFK